jgi:hypothetical protein
MGCTFGRKEERKEGASWDAGKREKKKGEAVVRMEAVFSDWLEVRMCAFVCEIVVWWTTH